MIKNLLEQKPIFTELKKPPFQRLNNNKDNRYEYNTDSIAILKSIHDIDIFLVKVSEICKNTNKIKINFSP